MTESTTPPPVPSHGGADARSAGAHPGEPRSLLILGSTGSIGTQALDVVATAGGFTVTGLAAGGSDVALLAEQVRAHRVPRVAVSSAAAAAELRAAVPGLEVLDGPDAATELVAGSRADVVLNGITGSRGLGPTLAALAAGSTLALANKESLVAGGPLVLSAAAPGQIVPVDSEHSALAQCLRAGSADEVARLVLTASGGPFRGRSRSDLTGVTVAEALKHPTWAMGPVVTINSATLVNKGLELIEAHLLFGVPYDRIDVTVHPQSIVHSMVTFSDGSTIAQASPPDMRLPIALGLAWPDRVAGAAAPCTWDTAQSWTFEPLDDDAFPGVALSRAAGEAGGCLPAVLNAANEELVEAFVAGAIGYTDITDRLSETLDAADGWTRDPATVADVLAAEEWARVHARERAGTGSPTC
ncbi:MAG: 1-deoxy-D-xylulose-5-phosphate reductoisomerase [Pseudonocardia sp.]|nr:1-deoxy-D-xylulose-5-phosphate reductoisomerase [Pseudonocardia sp.]